MEISFIGGTQLYKGQVFITWVSFPVKPCIKDFTIAQTVTKLLYNKVLNVQYGVKSIVSS